MECCTNRFRFLQNKLGESKVGFSCIQFVCKLTKIMKICLDSQNFVQENLCENGFSDSRRISHPICGIRADIVDDKDLTVSSKWVTVCTGCPRKIGSKVQEPMSLTKIKIFVLFFLKNH